MYNDRNKLNPFAEYLEILKTKSSFKEIGYLFLIGISCSVAFISLGAGKKVEFLEQSFGQSKILYWITFLIPFIITVKLTSLMFKTCFRAKEAPNVKPSVFLFASGVYWFISFFPTFVILLWSNTYFMTIKPTYLGTAIYSLADVEDIPYDERGYYRDELIEETVSYNDLTDVKNSLDGNIAYRRAGFYYWQTAVIAGFTPSDQLQEHSFFTPNEIFDLNDWFTYVFRLVPIYYMELFQKTLLAWSTILIIVTNYLVFNFFKRPSSFLQSLFDQSRKN